MWHSTSQIWRKSSKTSEKKKGSIQKKFYDHLNRLEKEFRRFQEVDKMEQIIVFVSNPFLQVDIGELTENFNQVFEQNRTLDMEMIVMQNDRAES